MTIVVRLLVCMESMSKMVAIVVMRIDEFAIVKEAILKVLKSVLMTV